MAINMTALINQELAKIEKRKSAYGESVDPAMDAFSQAWKMGQEQRAWNERKNAQRQGIMSELSRGTSMTFNEKDLARKKERFQNYYNKHRGSMDENTLEMGQFMLDDFDIQGQKNTDFNKLLGDGEQLKKDLAYDMENIGIDEEGNQRTLDSNDYEIISEMQKRWINHTKEMQTNFADRLSLKPFQHINQELANATNMNQFLLGQAREDNLIDDRELQAYQDAWGSGSYDPVAKYLNDEKAGRDASINFNINQLGQGAKRYQELHNAFANDGVIAFKDESTGIAGKYSLNQINAMQNGNKLVQGMWQEYNSLVGQLENLNKTNTTMTGSNFLDNTDIDLDQHYTGDVKTSKLGKGLDTPSRTEAAEVLAGTKDITDVTKVKETKEDTTLGMSDTDWSNVTDAGKVFAVGVGVSQADKIASGTKYLAKNTAKGMGYIKSAGRLTDPQVQEFLKSKSVKNTSKHLDKLEERLKTKGLKERSPETYKDIKSQINKIKNNQTKYWAKKFGVGEEDIARLYKTGNRKKWNVFKMKQNLKSKYPKILGKHLGKYGVGSMINDAVEWGLGVEVGGKTGVALDYATGHYAEKAVTKKFLPQLTKILTTDKGQKVLAKFMTKQAAKNLTRQAVGTAVPFWGNIAMGLVGAGMTAWDIHQLIKSYNEEEE